MEIYVYIVLGILIGFSLVAIGLGIWDLFCKGADLEDFDEIEYFNLR